MNKGYIFEASYIIIGHLVHQKTEILDHLKLAVHNLFHLQYINIIF